jgi:DNA-binding XRE family transcriptional regulator
MDDMPVPDFVFTQKTFEPAFTEDLRNAFSFVYLESAYISLDGVKRLSNTFANCIRRGVRVCAFIQPPDDWQHKDDSRLDIFRRGELQKVAIAMEALKSLGVHASFNQVTHLKLSVIDYKVTWGGSLNLLSYGKRTDEEMWRWTKADWAINTVHRRGYESCPLCTPQDKPVQPLLDRGADQMGAELAALRKAAGWTQQDLASKAGISRELLSDIERGLRCPRTDVAVRLYAQFEIHFMRMPPDMVSVVNRWMNLRH